MPVLIQKSRQITGRTTDIKQALIRLLNGKA
jgi:hypothetical protein